MIEFLIALVRWLRLTITKAALTAAAYDDTKLVAECSVTERNNAIVRGLLLVGFTCSNAALYMAVASYLADGFSLSLGIACSFVSVHLGLGDHYGLLRMAIYSDGLHALSDGGMRTNFLSPISPYSKLAKRLRVALSLIVSTVMAVGIGLILNSSAIDRRIE